MKTIVGAWIGGWGPDAHMLGVRDGPPAFSGLHRLIFAPQATLKAAITLWAFFVALLLLLLARNRNEHAHTKRKLDKGGRVSRRGRGKK